MAAGVLAALAAFWRPDLGAVAALAAVAVLGARRAWPAAGVAAGSAALAGAALYAPFAVAGGLPRLWDALVAEAARDGAAWRLPFPFGYEGPLRAWPPGALAEDAKDVLGFYLPLIGVAALALVAAALVLRARRGGGVAPAVAGLGVLPSGRSATRSRGPTSCTRSRC